MQTYNFDQSTTCFYHSLWISHCMMFYPFKSAKGVCISMHYFAPISKYTYSQSNAVSTSTLIWIALSSDSTNANFEINPPFARKNPLLTTLLDSLIGLPYWTSLLDILIGQPYWTAVLDSCIGQPYFINLTEYVLTYSPYKSVSTNAGLA